MLSSPEIAANENGLSYVNDAEPGFARLRKGKAFRYVDSKGRVVRDAATLDRIEKLVIPPAWEDVWICARANGHVQATGRDARGRKQHRYHPKFRAARDEAKFEHMAEFAAALPKLRAAIDKDRRRPGLPREKVLATIAHLLDASLIRVGNDEYAEQNQSFGLTTLRNRHVQIRGDEMKFVFKGKSGKTWNVRMKDRRVAKVIKATQHLPGQRLFEYLDDDGKPREITSSDVNAYLRDLSGHDITAKDFRTWGGTVLACEALGILGAATSETAAKRNIRDAIQTVAGRLGNTPTICRKCYVHPGLVTCYADGKWATAFNPKGIRARKGLSRAETLVLNFLKKPAPPLRKAA
jgi:DNA topoisomerase-1